MDGNQFKKLKYDNAEQISAFQAAFLAHSTRQEETEKLVQFLDEGVRSEEPLPGWALRVADNFLRKPVRKLKNSSLNGVQLKQGMTSPVETDRLIRLVVDRNYGKYTTCFFQAGGRDFIPWHYFELSGS